MNDQQSQQAPVKKWYHSVGFVITMLFCFGPFGLPLLFSSKEFSRTSKIVITVIVLLVTVVATVETIKIVQLFIEHYRSLFGIVV